MENLLVYGLQALKCESRNKIKFNLLLSNLPQIPSKQIYFAKFEWFVTRSRFCIHPFMPFINNFGIINVTVVLQSQAQIILNFMA